MGERAFPFYHYCTRKYPRKENGRAAHCAEFSRRGYITPLPLSVFALSLCPRKRCCSCFARPPVQDARSPVCGTAESRRHEAFESGNPRDAYSSVHHLKGNLDSLSFAIGLREEGGQEGALERLLPMLKIQPRPTGEVLCLARSVTQGGA